jgi:hypothetical protein
MSVYFIYIPFKIKINWCAILFLILLKGFSTVHVYLVTDVTFSALNVFVLFFDNKTSQVRDHPNSRNPKYILILSWSLSIDVLPVTGHNIKKKKTNKGHFTLCIACTALFQPIVQWVNLLAFIHLEMVFLLDVRLLLRTMLYFSLL